MNLGSVRNNFFKIFTDVFPKNYSSNTTSNSRIAECVVLTKCLENPIIVVSKNNQVDLIGPPNNISNLRPIIRERSDLETLLQKRLRKRQEETEVWNENFWKQHNTKFIFEKEKYVKLHLTNGFEKTILTADEMSEFYKSFLDEHWKRHVKYNYEWYKRNFLLLYLAFRVQIENYII